MDTAFTENPQIKNPDEKTHEEYLEGKYLKLLEDVEQGRTTKKEAARQLVDEHLRQENVADHDELTGLLNKRGFEKQQMHELSNLMRHNREASLLVVDADYLKEVNDKLGHDAGSDLLKVVASVLEECVRAGDLVARYGGDEFTILAQETNEGGAEILAKRIQEALEKKIKGKYNLLQVAPSLSIGIAKIQLPHSGISQKQPKETIARILENSAKEAFKLADNALYQSKMYRNSISTAHPDGTIVTATQNADALAEAPRR